jgi:3-oxoadipate enol-lactonase
MTQFVEANNAILRYEHVGNAESAGTPLLLIHELGGDMTSWDPALAAGLCANRPAMRFDWRGAGMSEKIRGAFDIDVMCDDIAGVIKETGFGGGQPVDILGIALGGGVVIAFAARYPELVRRMISTSSAIGGSAEAGARLKTRAEGVERDGMRPYCEASHAISFADHLRTDAKLYEWYRKKWIAQDPTSFAGHNRMLADMDEFPNLSKIKARSLVLAGTHDPLRPPELVKDIASKIPGAEYEELNTGHFMHVQTPALCAERIPAFLDQI